MAASIASEMPREAPPGWKLSGLSLLRWMLRTPTASRPDTLACTTTPPLPTQSPSVRPWSATFPASEQRVEPIKSFQASKTADKKRVAETAHHLGGGPVEALGVRHQPSDVCGMLWGWRVVRQSSAACGGPALSACNDVAVLAGRVETLQRCCQPRRARPQELGVLCFRHSALITHIQSTSAWSQRGHFVLA